MSPLGDSLTSGKGLALKLSIDSNHPGGGEVRNDCAGQNQVSSPCFHRGQALVARIANSRYLISRLALAGVAGD